MNHTAARTVDARMAGFTLVEVLAASIIGAFIAVVAVGSLRAVSGSAKLVDESIVAADEARFASSMIAADLLNLYRDTNTENMRLFGTFEESGFGIDSDLTFYTVGRAPARADQPEGDVYEVQYFLYRDEDRSLLMRRLWPYPQRDIEPGGVITVLAENIVAFEVRFFDGSEWDYEWPEEMASLPQLVEVNIAAGQPETATMARKSFVVTFRSSTGTEASALEQTEPQDQNSNER